MKLSRATVNLWDRACRRTNAERGLGDPVDAKHEILTVKQLMQQINSNPDALGLLAERQHELSPEQRRTALKAYVAAAPKAPKAAPKVKPPAPSRLSRTLAGVGLYGKSGTGAPS